MTSRWRHYCFGGLDFSEAPLQESVAMATATDLHSNFYLLTNSYIFSGKSPNVVELSFSLSELWAKNLKGGAKHSPGQDRVKKFAKFVLLVFSQNLKISCEKFILTESPDHVL